MYDQDFDSNGGMFDDQEPGDRGGTPYTPPPPYSGITYEMVGNNQAGEMIYKGTDGKYYIGDSNGMNGFSPYDGDLPGAVPTPTPTPAPGPSGGTGGGSLIQPFGETYTAPQPAGLPSFADSVATIPGAPQFPNIPKFAAPTMAEAMAEPGFESVLATGNRNLENWLSSRGMLNDSQAAKAFSDYGQGTAAQQYGNVWNRARDAYQLNTTTQYLDPFEAQYRNWFTGTVGPTMTNFSTNAQNVQHQNDVNWQDSWNHWLQDWNIFRDQRDSTFDKQFKTATA